MAKTKKFVREALIPLRTVSTMAAPANIASSERDEVVFGNGNFNLGCVLGSHKLDPTFLVFRFRKTRTVLGSCGPLIPHVFEPLLRVCLSHSSATSSVGNQGAKFSSSACPFFAFLIIVRHSSHVRGRPGL